MGVAMLRAKDCLTRGLFIVAAAWGGSLSWQLHKDIREQQIRQQSGYPQFRDFAWSVGICAAMVLVQTIFTRIFAPVARAMIKKKAKWSYAVWGAKVQRCCEAIFKCIYYVGMTAWGFQILSGKPWVPWVLGGHGDTRRCWTDGPSLQALPDDLRQFYLTAVGFHFSEVLMHMSESRHPDFWEMLLHHTLTCFLVSFSYLLNYTRIGSLVMLLHGATDIFIYLSKAVVDTTNVRLIVVSYFLLVAAYAWFRIYVFPAYIMRSAWIESIQANGEKLPGWGFLNFALCALLILHMYWFGLIIKIGTNFRKTGEARDMQSNLSAMDLQDKKKH